MQINKKGLVCFLIIASSVLMASCVSKPSANYDVYKDSAVVSRDEAPHIKNSLEWWYFTGHLQSQKDSTWYGVEYVVFHFNPRGKKDYLLVNTAISSPKDSLFVYDHKMTRQKTLLEDTLPLHFNVNKKSQNWTLQGTEGHYQIKAHMVDHPGFGYELNTQNQRPPLKHGKNGYEEYGDYAEAGYYSYTRLKTEGSLWVNEEEIPVKGTLWYDRQWNCISVLNEKGVGWDWMAVQLDSPKADLMVYRVRHPADSVPMYGGTLRYADNRVKDLGNHKMTIEEKESWKSPASGSVYPVKWNVNIPEEDLNLNIDAMMNNQELSISLFPLQKLHYWEGMSKASGKWNGNKVKGDAYVEVTGR